MMKGKVEPSTMLTLVKAMLIMVHVVKQIVVVPQMTSPHER
jgi:hypothetical protein